MNTSSFDGWDPIFEDMAYWSKFTESAVSSHDSYEELNLLFSLMEPGAHEHPDFINQVKTFFDVNQLVQWYAHSLLSGNLHVGGDNLRLIFDPSRGRFEPIPWDVFLISPRPLLSLPGNPLWNEVFAIPEWRTEVYRFLWEYVNDKKKVNADLDEATRLRSLIERAAYRDPLKLPSNRQVKNDLDARSEQIRMNFEFLHKELQVSELLITYRIPSHSVAAQGVGLILDVTVRGPVASFLSEMTVPLSIVSGGDIVVLRDNGNGEIGEEDSIVPLKRTKGITEDVITFSANNMILFPEQENVTDIGLPVGVPHTLHRFFIKGVRVRANDLPLQSNFKNAVTKKPSQLIRTTVIDESRYEDSVPRL